MNKRHIRVLVNIVTINNKGVFIAWLLKFRKIQSMGCEININGGSFVKKVDLLNCDLYKFNQRFSEVKNIQSDRGLFSLTMFFLLQNIKAIFRLFKIKCQSFDVVYSPSSVLDLVIFPFFLKLAQKKIVWVSVFDNTVSLRGSGKKIVRLSAWIFFQISVFLLRYADKIFVISAELKDYLVSRGFQEQKIMVSLNGIENDLIKKAKQVGSFSLDGLFIGRINRQKGVYDLLQVLVIIKKILPNFKLGIMGRGDYGTEINFRKKTQALGLSNNVVFLGYLDGQKKFDVIKSSKCFIFLSHNESFGIALLEAVCSGINAFVYDMDVYKKIYSNNEIKMYRQNDYQGVAQGVVDLFQSGKFYNKNGVKLLGRYDWGKIGALEYRSFFQ